MASVHGMNNNLLTWRSISNVDMRTKTIHQPGFANHLTGVRSKPMLTTNDCATHSVVGLGADLDGSPMMSKYILCRAKPRVIAGSWHHSKNCQPAARHSLTFSWSVSHMGGTNK